MSQSTILPRGAGVASSALAEKIAHRSVELLLEAAAALKLPGQQQRHLAAGGEGGATGPAAAASTTRPSGGKYRTRLATGSLGKKATKPQKAWTYEQRRAEHKKVLDKTFPADLKKMALPVPAPATPRADTRKRARTSSSATSGGEDVPPAPKRARATRSAARTARTANAIRSSSHLPDAATFVATPATPKPATRKRALPAGDVGTPAPKRTMITRSSARAAAAKPMTVNDDQADAEDRAEEADAGEDNTTTTNTGSTTANAKGPPLKWEGTSSGRGSSLESPPNAALTTPWSCGARDCTSGCTWFSKQAWARKVVSHHFGRNKADTARIPLDVWHTLCRKCYQRGLYKVRDSNDNPKAVIYGEYWLDLLHAQLERLELWRPNATFKVQLTKAARERLSMFEAERAANGGDDDAADAAVLAQLQSKRNTATTTRKSTRAASSSTATTNKKGKTKPLPVEEIFPIALLTHFTTHYATADATADYMALTQALTWIRARVLARETAILPPFEFLIAEVSAGETVHGSVGNYDAWIAAQDAKERESESSDGESQPEDEADEGVAKVEPDLAEAARRLFNLVR